MNLSNIWTHPKTSISGVLIALVTVCGVLSQQGITLGNAGKGTIVALIGAVAAALLGLMAQDSPSDGSSSGTKLPLLLLMLVIPCSLMLGCPSSSAVHKSSVAAASIGESLNTAAKINHELIVNGDESAAEGAQVATYIAQAARANDSFVAILKSLPKGGTQLTAEQAVTAFNTLQQQILKLNQQGVLHLKSQKAQASFAGVMTSIQASITAVQVMIAATSSRAPGSLPPLSSDLPLLGLLLTPVEIEELIALAAAAGSELVTKLMNLRGKTDEELQAAALASDAEAEQQAIADGAKIQTAVTAPAPAEVAVADNSPQTGPGLHNVVPA